MFELFYCYMGGFTVDFCESLVQHDYQDCFMWDKHDEDVFPIQAAMWWRSFLMSVDKVQDKREQVHDWEVREIMGYGYDLDDWSPWSSRTLCVWEQLLDNSLVGRNYWEICNIYLLLGTINVILVTNQKSPSHYSSLMTFVFCQMTSSRGTLKNIQQTAGANT